MSFDQLFEIKNGEVIPKVKVRIGTTTFDPTSFNNGVLLNRVNFNEFKGKIMEVSKSEDIYIITGYRP